MVHDATVPLHVQVAEAGADAWRGPVTVVGPQQPWPQGAPPAAVLAVGDRAELYAKKRWNDVPRASLLQWGPAPERGVAPLGWSGVHTEAACTAEQLRDSVPPGGPWWILAGPHDEQAAQLAELLGATLVRGEAREVSRQMREASPDSARIWLRPSRELAIPAWLRFWGLSARLPHIQVGADLPGAARFGIARWVRPDPVRAGQGAAEWLEDQLPRRRRRGKTPPSVVLLPIPCATPSTHPPG